jgi:hypothetical protein
MTDYGNDIFTTRESSEKWFGDITISEYKQSEWVCYMFGSSFCWRPAKGKHPNWFWRKMQYLLLGHRWVKEGE